MRHGDRKIQILFTIDELTELDEVLTAAIDGFDPEMFENDSAYEEGLEDLKKWEDLREKIQYHLS